MDRGGGGEETSRSSPLCTVLVACQMVRVSMLCFKDIER